MPLNTSSVEIPAGELTFTYPPADPWMAYFYIVLFLMISRLFLLVRYYDALITKYAPHLGGLRRGLLRLRKLGAIKGVYFLLVREAVTLVSPLALAIVFRLSFGHPGSIPWSSATVVIFSSFALVWIILDFLRILSIRKALKAVVMSKWSNPKLMTKVMTSLGWSLETLTSVANSGGETVDEPVVIAEETKVRRAARTTFRFLKSKTKDTASAAKREIESRVQKRVEKNTQMHWRKWLRDILFSVIPLSLIYILSFIFA